MANIKPLYFDVATGGFKGLSGSDAIDFGGILLSKSGSDLQWDGVSLATTNDVVTGLKIKGSVVAMADSNIDLSVATDGSTIDGASISNGDRVLLTGQSSAAENGIYVATTATAANSWSRASDMAASSDPALAFVFVEQGTSYADTGWVCTNNTGLTTIDGVVDVNFAQFSSLGAYTAGDGLTLTGQAFSVNVDDLTVEINANALRVKALGIDTAQLADGVVTADKIENNAVTSLKILDGAVSEDKIAGTAVSEGKIADAAVTELKIANAAVSNDKLASGALQPGNANVDHLCFTINGGETVADAFYRPLFVLNADDEAYSLDDMSEVSEVSAFIGLCGQISVADATAVKILRVNGVKIAPGSDAIGDTTGVSGEFGAAGLPVYLMDGGLLTTTDGDIASGDYYLQVGVSVSNTEMVTEFGRAPVLKP